MKSYIQYCEKVMRAKCANFVLCPCELSAKFRSKIRASFRDVSRVISLKQREKIRRIFEPSAKIRSNNKERKFAAFSRPARKFALKTKGENSPHFRDQREKPKALFRFLYAKFQSVVCKDRSHIDRLFSFVNNCSHFYMYFGNSSVVVSVSILYKIRPL